MSAIGGNFVGKKILVTGGAGFVGSNFVRLLLEEPQIEKIRILDKLTYSGSIENLENALDNPKVSFIRGDIIDFNVSAKAISGMNWVINFAAESHVDRSLFDPSPFMATNVEGVRVLLELTRKHKIEKFLQVSTDEVYGSIIKYAAEESTPLKPSSPYSASKAAADMLCNAYFVSYNVPVIIARSSNNYGPYQYPEKLIPRFVSLTLRKDKLPLFGDGKNIRDWLYVEDNCKALLLLLQKGILGEIYNIGASELHQNIEITKLMLDILNKPYDIITYVKDRLGHDKRYCINWEKIGKLGWKPQAKFIEKFTETINWYKKREKWLNKKTEEAEEFYSKKFSNYKEK